MGSGSSSVDPLGQPHLAAKGTAGEPRPQEGDIVWSLRGSTRRSEVSPASPWGLEVWAGPQGMDCSVLRASAWLEQANPCWKGLGKDQQGTGSLQGCALSRQMEQQRGRHPAHVGAAGGPCCRRAHGALEVPLGGGRRAQESAGMSWLGEVGWLGVSSPCLSFPGDGMPPVGASPGDSDHGFPPRYSP